MKLGLLLTERAPLYAGIGGVAALLIHWLDDKGLNLPGLPYGDSAAAAGIFAGALFFLLADRGVGRLASGLAALAMGCAIALMHYDFRMRFPGPLAGFGAGEMAFPLAFLVFLIALPFFQAWHESRTWRFDYGRLADFAWSNSLRAALAALFVCLLWLVLALWMALFKAIGIDFFKELFTNAWVAFGLSGAALGLGLAILARWTVAIERLHALLHGLFSALSLVVVPMVVVFVPSLIFGRLDALWGSALTTGMMLALILLALVLVNDVIGARDEDMPANPRHALRIAALVLIVSLPVVAVLASLSLGRRIDAYGLTPDRFYGVVALAFALAFGTAYVGALIRCRAAWPAGVRRVNLVLAPLVALVAFLLATPLLSAEHWSARNQTARLMAGKVALEDFDFMFLRFRAGKAGQQALDDLLKRRDYPHYDALAARVETVRREETPYGMIRAQKLGDGTPSSLAAALDAGRIAVWPADSVVPTGLADGSYIGLDVSPCAPGQGQAPRCFLLLANLWGSQDQAVLVTLHQAPGGREWAALHLLMRDEAAGWRASGGNRVVVNRDVDALYEALLAGDIGLQPIAAQQLRIGDAVFEPMVMDRLRVAPRP